MPEYIGRFAPSPTGLLHAGSLLTAVASYLDAKAHNGTWLVRIEDLDPPREVQGASDHILATLKTFGLHWDGDITYQSQRHSLYETALESLLKRQLAFYCTCTRKQLTSQKLANSTNPHSNHSASPYPGNCRMQHEQPNTPSSVRLRVPNQDLCLNDGIQDKYCQQLELDVGDFIIKRKDGLFAYHLAMVVDDHLQHITHVIRGADLLDNTPRQCFLQQCLEYSSPHYSHVPIVVNSQGQKLSKQTFAEPVAETNPSLLLWKIFSALHLNPKPSLKKETPEALLRWGTSAWDISRLKGQTSILSTSVSFNV